MLITDVEVDLVVSRVERVLEFKSEKVVAISVVAELDNFVSVVVDGMSDFVEGHFRSESNDDRAPSSVEVVRPRSGDLTHVVMDSNVETSSASPAVRLRPASGQVPARV